MWGSFSTLSTATGRWEAVRSSSSSRHPILGSRKLAKPAKVQRGSKQLSGGVDTDCCSHLVPKTHATLLGIMFTALKRGEASVPEATGGSVKRSRA